ncbi:MAG: CocE/NonD family hydrolase [Candidatus Lernaella stagnicola]|nr:CocE/NonD family hydrolase [Candidatus Lernaella stagnicola]
MRWRLYVLLLMVVLVVPLLGAKSADEAGDRAWWQNTDEPVAKELPYTGYTRSSFYLPMRDGVRIAVDLYLPKGLPDGEKIPAALSQTRYWRRLQVNKPFGLIFKMTEEIERIVQSGYALVRLDARGTGASFGTRTHPWTADETKDGAQVVDWIVRQPWSNGRVGAAGGSYEGTTAEFLAINKHPAVKAIAPMFALYDTYTDIAYPGGIHLEWFTEIWERGNRAMDLNQPQSFYWFARLFLRGVAPVDRDRWGKELAEAARVHRGNYQVHQEARQLVFRDDVSPGGFTPDVFSPHAYADDLRAAGIPIYSYSGWFDGGYAHAAVKRHLTVRNQGSRLILGPWDHGGDDRYRPFAKPTRAKFDHIGELLRFFDRYLKDEKTGIENEPPVHYYTMVEDRWKEADTWPPPATPTRFHLGDAKSLLRHDAPVTEGVDEYRVDRRAGTGSVARWNSLAIGLAVRYPDRKRRDKRLLVYDSAPLPEAMEVTGHPIVELYLSSDQTDAQVFAYLEDVEPHGDVALVTEGMLRAVHRRLSDGPPPYRTPAPYHTFLRRDAQWLRPGQVVKLRFDLLPVSHLFREGHRIRLALAGEDIDHFRSLPTPRPTWRVYRGGATPSHLMLPVVR